MRDQEGRGKAGAGGLGQRPRRENSKGYCRSRSVATDERDLRDSKVGVSSLSSPVGTCASVTRDEFCTLVHDRPAILPSLSSPSHHTRVFAPKRPNGLGALNTRSPQFPTSSSSQMQSRSTPCAQFFSRSVAHDC